MQSIQPRRPNIEVYFSLKIAEEFYESYAEQESAIENIGVEIESDNDSAFELSLLLDDDSKNSKDKLSKLFEIVSTYHMEYTNFSFLQQFSMSGKERNLFAEKAEDFLNDEKLDIEAVAGREALSVGSDYSSSDDIEIHLTAYDEPVVIYDVTSNQAQGYLKIEKCDHQAYEIIGESYIEDDVSEEKIDAALELILKIRQAAIRCLYTVNKDNERNR